MSFAFLYDDKELNVKNFIEDIRKETDSKTLGYCYLMDRCYLCVKDELFLIPKIIQAILDHGQRLYINDGSGITFPMYSRYSKTLLERRELELLLELLRDGGLTQVKSLYKNKLLPDDWTSDKAKKIMEKIASLSPGEKRDFTKPLFNQERSMYTKILALKYNKKCDAELLAKFKKIQNQIAAKYDSNDEMGSSINQKC